MARAVATTTPKEARIRRLGEVSLGLNKKIAQDESRRCPQCAVATCMPGCPLGIDVPGFIRLLREGETVLALERIKKENPFPAICGRICPAPCERACVFHSDGTPISIRNLERFASDFGTKGPGPILGTGHKIDLSPKWGLAPSKAPSKKVAIIGSGPAGMSAAYFLARNNLGVTIFEAAHQPGGLLRYGVPEFRLPQKILDEQFTQLKAWGVEIVTDAVLGRTISIEEIFMQGFACVLLATGASLPKFSELPGSNLAGVYYDVEFLSRLQATAKEDALETARQQMLPSLKTVVIGCGQSAFDAGRLSLRMGSQAQVIFEGFEEQAGVDAETLQEAREEGLETHSMQAVEILGDDEGFATGVKCLPLNIVESKEGLSLEPSNEGPVVLEAQTVVLANGHRPNGFLKQYLPKLKWNEDGSLWTDASSGMTSIDKVFGCGNVTAGGGAVVDAILSGKTIAPKIIQYLSQA